MPAHGPLLPTKENLRKQLGLFYGPPRPVQTEEEKYAKLMAANKRYQQTPAFRASVRKASHKRRAKKAAAVENRWTVDTRYPQSLCYWCGLEVFNFLPASHPAKKHIDHVMPISLGGPASPRNEVPSCSCCNHKKKNKHPLVWIAELLR